MSTNMRQNTIVKNLKKAIDGNNEAFEQILNASKPIIDSILKSYQDYGLSEELLKDLRQECDIYIWSKVIRTYDISKGATFTTYLHQQLRGHLQAIYPKYKMIPFTSDFKKEAKKISIKLPMDRTVQEEIKLKMFHIVNNNDYSFTGNEKDSSLEYTLKEDIRLNRLAFKEEVQRILTKTEYKVLMLMRDEYTGAEIAEALSVSRQYINKLSNQIKYKLQSSDVLSLLIAS